jgi:hypothetical protein
MRGWVRGVGHVETAARPEGVPGDRDGHVRLQIGHGIVIEITRHCAASGGSDNAQAELVFDQRRSRRHATGEAAEHGGGEEGWFHGQFSLLLLD